MPSKRTMTNNELLATLESSRSHISELKAELSSAGLEGAWNKLKFIAEITKDSISLIGRDYVYEATNKSYQDTLDEGPRSIIGRTVEQVWGEKTFKEVVKPHLDQCFEGTMSYYETWFEFHGKGRGCFEVSYYPYSNDEVGVTHAVVITRDITARKEAEEELFRHREQLQELVEEKTRNLTLALKQQKQEIVERKQAQEALGESEERFSALSRATFEAVFISDKGVCVEANEAASEMFGYSNDELLGRFGTDAVVPESKEMVKARMVAGDEKPYEAIALRKDGTTFPAEFRGKMFPYKGRPIRATSVRDLTERKRTEEALSQAKVAAEDANRAKSEFLANMSHELRTPLNGIMGMLQMAESTPLTEKQQEYIDSALGASESLLSVINDILDISKVEAGKLEVEEEEFHLREILHVVSQVLRQEAINKKVNLHYTINEDVPSLLIGDSARLRQILFNLLGNSLKFTEQGEVHVRVGFEPPDGDQGLVKLVFAVSDTGMGIPEEYLQRIFEPFFQVSGGHTRKFQGTGLGLAIVKRLVEAMGGGVSVESRVGKGTTIHFHVLVKAASPASVEPLLDDEPSADVSSLSPLRVLLVDDNTLNLRVLQIFFEKEGHAIVGATTGLEALAALEKDHFDVVFMDVQMPDMDGVKATKCIRSGQCGVNMPDIPIVVVTAYAMQGDREQFLAAGADDYLAKPLTVKGLQDVLVRVMGK
jgi:PAS domain S-box-containing protein